MYRFAILLLIIIGLALNSCSSKDKSNIPEGNIDVDSDIYIVPIGDVDIKYINAIVPKLEKRFTTNVYVEATKRMPLSNNDYDYDAQKYISMYILHDMTKKLKFPPNARVLGVTNVDMFVPESGYTFLFGQSFDAANMALISTARMDPRSYVRGKPDDPLLIQRMEKEAVHELGHLFRLENVPDPGCVMFLPTDLKSLDRKTDSFCLLCQKEFADLKEKAKSNPFNGKL
jgi:archaemetzincin